MTDTNEDDLRKMIKDGQVVVVVGSGVSMATNPKSPTWRGLIESAIDYCRFPEKNAKPLKLLLELEADDMLLAADRVHTKLRQNGEFTRWLRETFETLKPVDRTAVKALAELGAPLVTTNYDDLIEKVTGLRAVTWKEQGIVTRVVRGDDRRVLHLHGHWEVPDSVVLGIKSYDAVKQSEHTQSVLKAFGMHKSFLFVGCGDEGLNDPNFGKFLTWLKEIEAEAGADHRHYRLVTSTEKVERNGRVFPLVYGDKYDQLPGFLQSLCPKPVKTAGAKKKAAPRPRLKLPDSITAYLNRLANETSRLKLLGMGRSLQIDLPIADAYVPLRTKLVRSMEEHGTERLKDRLAEYETDIDLADVFHETSKVGLRGIVLLGEPGAGKTTGARQIAWRLASGESLPEDLGLPAGITPVLLHFRKLSRAALAEQNGLKTFLLDETKCELAGAGLENPGDALRTSEHGLLWILDGLDEVIDPVARARVSGWIKQAIVQRPRDRFLITCRFAGYFRDGVSLGPQFVEFHVRPLDEDQVRRFVHDWFQTAYTLLKKPELAPVRTSKLLEVLSRPEYQTQKLKELCTNPLMLTILCIVFHDQQQDLPRDRAALYEECVRVLLQHWRREVYELELGREVPHFDGNAAQSVLARVAWWMHGEQNRTAAAMEELAAQAQIGLSQVAASCGLGHDGAAFIQRMKDETGILAGDNEGRCGFLHLSFQEFLAADYAARELLGKELAARSTESWWIEVVLLALSRVGPLFESFFRELLSAGIVEERPDIAEQCLTESKSFSATPFVEVLTRPSSPRRVAAVLRLVRDRTDQVPGLAEIVRPFAMSKDRETQGFATEILARSRIVIPAVAETENVFVDARTGITFVTIPAGEFDMGSVKSPHTNERPVRHVRLTYDFCLGKYPVTNEQYGLFLNETDGTVKPPKYWEDRRYNQPEQPVVGVSWNDAMKFCRWAECRLPTEAEWEYACRAGSTTDYCFGDDPKLLGDYAWFRDNSGGQTQPVGTKRPNEWDLHDMHGNVWEWCQDWYGKYSDAAEVDPTGPKNGDSLVLRGGSFYDYPQDLRSANRVGRTRVVRNYDIGFRVSRTP